MWERAAKARRVDVDSPSTSRPQVISIESHAQAQSTPSVEHQPEAAAATNNSDSPNAREPETEIAATIPNDQVSIEPVVASNEPQLTTAAAETEPSPLSPIRDGELCNTDTPVYQRIAYPIRIGYGYVSDTPWIRILGVSDFLLFSEILDTWADTYRA